jgi:hypothetical protein
LGIASLVFGFILIGAGVVMAIEILDAWSNDTDPDAGLAALVGFTILVAPLCAFGGVLLRKYDRDKKKEKNS